MSLEQTINDDLKLAMKSRDKVKLDTLRGVKKEILEAKTAKGASGEISSEVEMKILNKMVKQRQESALIYSDQGRSDLAADELTQLEVLSAYLPEQMSVEAIDKAVSEIIKELGADSMAAMGKVMGVASKRLSGKADGKIISEIVRAKLSS